MQSTLNKNSPKVNPDGNKAKYWTFTIINPNDAHIRKFEDIKEFTTYWIYGKETCPTTGTLHFQCYLAGKKQITKPTMRKWFGDGGNFYAVSLGTPEENKTYCSKDAAFTEWGILPEARHVAGGEATKQKWTQIVELSKTKNHEVLIKEHPKEFLIHFKNIKQIGFDFSISPADLDSPCGEWIFGPTGVGKSTTARRENPGAFIKPMNKWWDNYNGEDVVILEDMSPSFSASMEYFMKIWPDCFAFPAEIKNHTVKLRPKKFIVTSQYHPRQIWFKEAYDAIIRRFKVREIQAMVKKDEVLISKKSNPKPKLQVTIKKHDKPYMKEKKIKKTKQPKIGEEKPEKVEPKPFVLTYEQAKTMFTPVPQVHKPWDNKIHIEDDAQNIDKLIDCAEIDAIHAIHDNEIMDEDHNSQIMIDSLTTCSDSSGSYDSSSESDSSTY